MEGLIFGGAYIRWEICITKSIGLDYSWKANKTIYMSYCTVFALCFILYLRAISM